MTYLKMLGGFFKSWRTWAEILVVALVVGTYVHRGMQLDAAHQAVADKANELTKTQTNLGIANDRIEAQNAATDYWNEEAAHQQARVKEAQQRAADTAKAYQSGVTALLMSPVPKGCTAAVRWGAEQASALSAGWAP